MTRIKKRGLDYFPMDADFTRKPAMRRIMKKEGEGAAMVLIEVLCIIYSQEGYYVKVDDLFYEDVAAGCYERNEYDVRRIIALSVAYGIFDKTMFAQHAILTSVDIQQQFLHCTRRRVNQHLNPKYIMVDDVDAPEVQPARAQRAPRTRKTVASPIAVVDASSKECVTYTNENVTSEPYSIAEQSIAEQSINTPSRVPLQQGEVEEGEYASPMDNEHSARGQQEWTLEALEQLRPPADHRKRNFDGLLLTLRQFRISPAEQYAIIRKSNYGLEGHVVWKGLYALRDSGGKIKHPGRFLLSLR